MANKRLRPNLGYRPSMTPESNIGHIDSSRPKSKTKNQHSRYEEMEIDFILELAFNYRFPNSSIILLYKACFAHKARETFGEKQVNYVKATHGGKSENNIPAQTGHDFKKIMGKMTPSAKTLIMRINLQAHSAQTQDVAIQVLNSSVQPMEPTYPEVAAAMLSTVSNMLTAESGPSQGLLPMQPPAMEAPMTPHVTGYAMNNSPLEMTNAASSGYGQNSNCYSMPPAHVASPATETPAFPAPFLEPSIPDYMTNGPALPTSLESLTPQVNLDFDQAHIQLPPPQTMAHLTEQTPATKKEVVATTVAYPEEEQLEIRPSSADYEAYGVLAPLAERVDVVMGNAFYKTHIEDPVINPCLPISPFHAMNDFQVTGHAVMLQEYVKKR